MLPAPLRMRRSGDFPLTIRRGVRVGRATMVVHCRSLLDADGVVLDQEARIGFVVSKAVGGAVVRNSVRRRLRGLVIQMRDSLPHGADIVVRALPLSATADYAVLGADLGSALAMAQRRLAAPASKRPR